MTTPVSTRYLVESYCARLDHAGLTELVERAGVAAAAGRREGLVVRHVRSYLVPEDEMCMHVFESSTAEAVRLTAGRAGIDVDRIVETLDEDSGQHPTAPPPTVSDGRNRREQT